MSHDLLNVHLTVLSRILYSRTHRSWIQLKLSKWSQNLKISIRLYYEWYTKLLKVRTSCLRSCFNHTSSSKKVRNELIIRGINLFIYNFKSLFEFFLELFNNNFNNLLLVFNQISKHFLVLWVIQLFQKINTINIKKRQASRIKLVINLEIPSFGLLIFVDEQG